MTKCRCEKKKGWLDWERKVICIQQGAEVRVAIEREGKRGKNETIRIVLPKEIRKHGPLSG